MSIFGKLFASDEAVNNIVNKDDGLLTQVGGWVGGMNYTEEEKAEANAATREWGLKQLDALSQFKVVQRILAFSVAFIWIFVAINFIAMLWLDWSTLDSMKEFAFSQYVWMPTALVFSLYFGGGVVDSIKRKS